MGEFLNANSGQVFSIILGAITELHTGVKSRK